MNEDLKRLLATSIALYGQFKFGPVDWEVETQSTRDRWMEVGYKAVDKILKFQENTK